MARELELNRSATSRRVRSTTDRGYWIIRFPDPDDELAKALKKIERL